MVNVINTISGGSNEPVYETKRQRKDYLRAIYHVCEGKHFRTQKEAPTQKGKTASVASIWTQANTKYKLGEPMLSEEDLKATGPSCVGLHNHYMLESANGVDNICASYQAYHFGSTVDILYALSDLYDLFHLDALDISLLRCFSFAFGKYMETKGAKPKSKAAAKLTHKTDF
ncbi:hypothetical protein C2845_PM10G10730 [Panicum miliaceum]|uniref:Uncharacterized protein n=1 Tax=Panicum miliaceum TaxID=4540 RepID=A0A3L6PIX8_PANMI|nr:hypothetical protein C2845_PM10G10730 [Panicum miliaceum]